jgi:hypothetical protein
MLEYVVIPNGINGNNLVVILLNKTINDHCLNYKIARGDKVRLFKLSCY